MVYNRTTVVDGAGIYCYIPACFRNRLAHWLSTAHYDTRYRPFGRLASGAGTGNAGHDRCCGTGKTSSTRKYENGGNVTHFSGQTGKWLIIAISARTLNACADILRSRYRPKAEKVPTRTSELAVGRV